jgi:pyruvate dehydrogenase phosphatase regulatory subunit
LAGGIGKYMAELIHTGNTDHSTWPIDIRRFMRLHTNKRFLKDRLREIPGRHNIDEQFDALSFCLGKQYSLKYPTYGMSLYRTGRKLRVSALHPKLQALGAVFGEVLGYERPLFFEDHDPGKSGLIR